MDELPEIVALRIELTRSPNGSILRLGEEMRSSRERPRERSMALLVLVVAQSLHFLECAGYTKCRDPLPLPLLDRCLRRRRPEGVSFRGVESALELLAPLGCTVAA